MSDFHQDRNIKTRKAHRCEQCGTQIDKGSVAVLGKGTFEGRWYGHHVHIECNKAAHAYAAKYNVWGEDFPWFQHMESDPDLVDLLLAKFPVVAERMGFEAESKGGAA